MSILGPAWDTLRDRFDAAADQFRPLHHVIRFAPQSEQRILHDDNALPFRFHPDRIPKYWIQAHDEPWEYPVVGKVHSGHGVSLRAGESREALCYVAKFYWLADSITADDVRTIDAAINCWNELAKAVTPLLQPMFAALPALLQADELIDVDSVSAFGDERWALVLHRVGAALLPDNLLRANRRVVAGTPNTPEQLYRCCSFLNTNMFLASLQAIDALREGMSKRARDNEGAGARTEKEHPAITLWGALNRLHGLFFISHEFRKMAERRTQASDTRLKNLNALASVASKRMTERRRAGASFEEAMGEMSEVNKIADEPIMPIESPEYIKSLGEQLQAGKHLTEQAREALRAGGAMGLDAETRPNAAGQPRSIELHTKLADADRLFAGLSIAIVNPSIQMEQSAEEMDGLGKWFGKTREELGAVLELHGVDAPNLPANYDNYRGTTWIRKATGGGLDSDLLGKMLSRGTLKNSHMDGTRRLYDVEEVARKQTAYGKRLRDALAEDADFRKPRKAERTRKKKADKDGQGPTKADT